MTILNDSFYCSVTILIVSLNSYDQKGLIFVNIAHARMFIGCYRVDVLCP